MGLQRLANLVLSNKPRYVTVEGILISEGVVTTSVGYTHPTYGRLTAVVPHTFHDGPEALEVESGEAWWEADPDLLAMEIAHMAAAFPAFSATNTAGRPGWEGAINTGRGHFDVRLEHRPDHSIPRIDVIRPRRLERRAGRRMQRAPHLFDNGSLCVASERDWDPARHNAVTAVAWTAHWLAVYSVWRMSSEKWPTQTRAA